MKQKFHPKVGTSLLSTGLLSLTALAAMSPAQAGYIGAPPANSIGDYLIIGNMDKSEGDAVNVQNTELGANRQVLSDGSSVQNTAGEAGPNTRDVFYQGGDRWRSTYSPTSSSDTHQAAEIFEGIDWTGNVAVTSDKGRFSMSNMDVFADKGVQCAYADLSKCDQSVSNTYWFEDQKTNHSGQMPNNGVSSLAAAPLINQMVGWKAFIDSLTADVTWKDEKQFENKNRKDSGGPVYTNIDDIDADGNNDGFAVIDIKINKGDSDWELNNTDWIIDGTGDVLSIFRILGDSNMNMSNTSILLGDGGIGFDDDNPNQFRTSSPWQAGAIFYKGDENDSESTDSVFNGDNVVLNGVALWDMVAVDVDNVAHNADGSIDYQNTTGSIDDKRQTEIVINNGQGCAQFISSKVNMNDVRWNRCSAMAQAIEQPDLPDVPDPDQPDVPDVVDDANDQPTPANEPEPEAVPEPISGIILGGLGLAKMMRKQRNKKALSNGSVDETNSNESLA